MGDNGVALVVVKANSSIADAGLIEVGSPWVRISDDGTGAAQFWVWLPGMLTAIPGKPLECSYDLDQLPDSMWRTRITGRLVDVLACHLAMSLWHPMDTPAGKEMDVYVVTQIVKQLAGLSPTVPITLHTSSLENPDNPAQYTILARVEVL